MVAYVTLNKQEDADLLLPSGFLNPHQNITPFEDVFLVTARPWGSYKTGRTVPEQCGWSVFSSASNTGRIVDRNNKGFVDRNNTL